MVSMSLFVNGSSSELESTGGGGFFIRTACCGFEGSFFGLPRRFGSGFAGGSGGASGIDSKGSGVGSGGSGVGSGGYWGSGIGSSNAGDSAGSKETIFY